MRHVAVVAAAAARTGSMVCVLFDVAIESRLLMTLLAGMVAVHFVGQHIAWVATMHGVAGKAGKLAALIAGRLNQAVVLIAANTACSVVPERVFEFFRKLLVQLVSESNHSNRVLKFLAGSVSDSPRPKIGRFGGEKLAVALPANLRSDFQRRRPWIDDVQVMRLCRLIWV